MSQHVHTNGGPPALQQVLPMQHPSSVSPRQHFLCTEMHPEAPIPNLLSPLLWPEVDILFVELLQLVLKLLGLFFLLGQIFSFEETNRVMTHLYHQPLVSSSCWLISPLSRLF